MTIETLVALLAEESRMYGEMLRLGQAERAALVGNDPTDLNAVIAAKEALVDRIVAVEGERLGWIGGWAREKGIDQGTVTLATITQRLPSEEAGQVAALRDELLGRIRDTAEMNYQNGQLVTSALRIVGRSIDAFTRVTSSAGYEPTGARVRSARTAVLDRRA